MTKDSRPSIEMVEATQAEVGGSNPVESPWSMIRTHWRLVIYASLANIGPLMFGYDMVVIGAITALSVFRRDFGSPVPGGSGATVIPALWLALWNALVQAGAAVGSVMAGWFQDRFGRRATFLLGGAFGLTGTTICYISGLPGDTETRRGVFLLGKIIIGLGCGVLMTSCQTWISEVSPKSMRGFLLGFYAFNVSFGHLLAIVIVFSQNGVMSPYAYQMPFGTQWAFGGVAVLAGIVLPESPVWLVANDHIEKAAGALRKLGTDSDSSLLMRIQASLAHEGSGAPTFKECFQNTDLRRTLIIVWLNMIQSFVGMSILANSAYFLIMAGMSPRYSLMVNSIGIAAAMVGNMTSWYTVPRFGRRSLILISLGLDNLAWLSMGIAACFTSAAAQWYVGVALLLFGFFNSLGVASAVPVIGTELSSVRLRSRSASLGFGAQSITSWVFMFFTPYLYNTDELNWGGKIGFFFMGTGMLAFALTWWCVPETKGRTFQELDHLFENKVAARAFKKSVVPRDEVIVGEQKVADRAEF
ncbi:general substrate transporter [Plectosphaerella plurivora]|uniref:General substrate transporter n=1 Tax=Plectosphaerella plurivora TaxID=936078 RepID=A0A9P8V2S1_9PEZI|nr:general substrate transporter [Plectosphaerella plurivora]